ncbi:MAG: UDP-N-acetylmuramoyl-L-alanine--D-glutamate ligase [Lachnospiraceae bacterium]|nr:UDP-N-acetylmuramoyl-L-alanine--D-glutamate ligase [Lachnospiraceae bacterium]
MAEYKKFDNKKIMIWGYGREGKSTEEFIRRSCKPASVKIFEGKREEFDLSEYDYVVKSPGIRLEGESDLSKFTSQTRIFLETYRDQTVGITGTKGKSTTSAMLNKVLSDCTDRNVILMGNIGLPALDYCDSVTDDTIIVYEMSCHQALSTNVSPHVSVFLNLFEEHLDYYGTLDKYFEAKSHIALYQKAGDYYLQGDNVPVIETPATRVVIDSHKDYDHELSIEGIHNRFNAEFVYRIATEIYGCDADKVKRSMKEFTGLQHRLQLVTEKNGVRFYDDSISTIPEAAISAAGSIKDTRTLLIGGMDRGIDYSKLSAFVREHDEYIYIFMYASGLRIYSEPEIESLEYTYYCEDLKQAVDMAIAKTEKGAIVLSPAAASYGYFKNFEERGDVFRELVKTLLFTCG